MGYEAWKKGKPALHAQMVNGRSMHRATLDHLVKMFGNRVFVVGHTHFRSGDRDALNGYSLRKADHHEGGVLATLCSTQPSSGAAGQYIAYEFEWARRKEQRLYGRTGVAFPCIARFADEEVPWISEEHIVRLQDIL